jgi:MoxR-like ATPase
MVSPEDLYSTLLDEVHEVLIGNEEVVERLTISLLTRGHVLLEGVPGVAKTTIAKLFTTASGLDYSRIQMTPDILPADITGTYIYREELGEFELMKGPVFANVVVADEINRATPKTQSALLEAMQERTVTIEGTTQQLPRPFMVVATQNPIEMEGTFELPEAQRDRFQFKLNVGIQNEAQEMELLERFDADPGLDPERISPVVGPEDILAAQEAVSEVYVDRSIKRYIYRIVTASREHPDVEFGGSPRVLLALLNGSKARAAIHGRDYVTSDDVKDLIEPTLTHRIILSSEAELSSRTQADLIAEIREGVTPPSSSHEDTTEPAVSDGGAAGDGRTDARGRDASDSDDDGSAL